jgi:hypothetical protein
MCNQRWRSLIGRYNGQASSWGLPPGEYDVKIRGRVRSIEEVVLQNVIELPRKPKDSPSKEYRLWRVTSFRISKSSASEQANYDRQPTLNEGVTYMSQPSLIVPPRTI